MYQKIIAFSYRRKEIKMTLKEKNGHSLIDSKDKKERWREYIIELYGDDNPQKPKKGIDELSPSIMDEKSQ